MKCLIILFNVGLILMTLSHCMLLKSSGNGQKEDSRENIMKLFKSDSLNQKYVKVSCNGKEDVFDKKLGRTLNNDVDLIYCISNKAFEGDVMAENQLAEIFPYLLHPFGNLYPLRGEKLFPLVLTKLNNFTIKHDETAMSNYPYFAKNSMYLVDMIESINRQNLITYLEKNMVYPNTEKYDYSSDEYRIEEAKASWFCINEAYTKGLIKFKPYGQK